HRGSIQRGTRLGGWFVPLTALLLAGCSVSSGGDGNGSDGPQVTIVGTVSFDRLVFADSAGAGLDAATPVRSPARGVQVEAIAAGSTRVLATAVTDDTGAYSVDVPVGSNVFMRVKARMERTGQGPSWRFSVLNNTNG